MESKVKNGWYILISSIIVLQSMLNYAQTKLYMKEGVFYAENDIKNRKAGKTLNKMFSIGESDKDKNCTFYNFMTFTTDDIGNIYVIDGRKTIMKYDKNGKYIMNFAGTGEGPGEFRSATKIFHKDKCIYLLDNILYRITKYSTNGKYISSMKITKLAEIGRASCRERV